METSICVIKLKSVCVCVCVSVSVCVHTQEGIEYYLLSGFVIVFVTVLISLTKYPTRQLKVERVYFGPQFDVTVHHHGEDMAGANKKGSNGDWLIGKQLVVLYPQLVHREPRMLVPCWLSFLFSVPHGMMPLILKVGLSSVELPSQTCLVCVSKSRLVDKKVSH